MVLGWGSLSSLVQYILCLLRITIFLFNYTVSDAFCTVSWSSKIMYNKINKQMSVILVVLNTETVK